jgi:hypothetical protein
MQWTGAMMICCGMTAKQMGMSGARARKMKALTAKMEGDTDW